MYNYWDASLSTTALTSTSTKTVYDPSPVGTKVASGNAFETFKNETVSQRYSGGY